MDELAYIKKVEAEVAGAIENARRDTEIRFSKAKSMRESRIQGMIDKANMEIEIEINDAKKKAEKEADEILKGIDLKLDGIEKKSSKNLDNAAGIIIDEFLNIK